MSTVIENEKYRVKVYAPPREHNPPHVHIVKKSDNAEIRISLIDLSIMDNHTEFDRKSIKEILYWIHDNYETLKDKWEELHGQKKTK